MTRRRTLLKDNTAQLVSPPSPASVPVLDPIHGPRKPQLLSVEPPNPSPSAEYAQGKDGFSGHGAANTCQTLRRVLGRQKNGRTMLEELLPCFSGHLLCPKQPTNPRIPSPWALPCANLTVPNLMGHRIPQMH